MQIRMFGTLLFSASVALSAFAQQTPPNSSAQPAASADQTAPASQKETATGKAPLQPVHTGTFWDGDEPGVGRLIFHPFASKDYVRRQTVPIRDRLNELDELTNSHAKMVKEGDTRYQQGIQLASEKSKQADQHALDATNNAQTAHGTATKANTRVTTDEGLLSGIDEYKGTNHTEIRFRPGQNVLSKDAKQALDEMAAPLKDQRGYVIEVRGFSPGQGQAGIASSRQIADAVERYLVQNKEIPAYRIHVMALGNAAVAAEEGTASKHTSRRRVDVSVLKNDLDQWAANAGTPK